MTEYKLTNETKKHEGVILHRIELTADCWWGKKGDKGGWVQSSDNLSEDAWVSGNAEVLGNARVSGNAEVLGNARVSGNAEVLGNAKVYGDAKVWGNACVFGNAMVSGNAQVYGDAMVYGNARVYIDMILTDGKWDSTQMFVHIPKGPTMNMSGPGILRIGCYHKPIGEWLKDEGYKYRRYVWIFADEYGL